VIHLLALAGVLTISFSAIFVRLAAVSPVTAAFFRAAYAVPVLFLISRLRSRTTTVRDRAGPHVHSTDRSARERWLAFGSGVILAIDLVLWHESIALVGAGLGTVIANVQVVFVALAGWLLYRQRPSRTTIAVIATVLCGVALTSGFARADAYGSDPVLGAAIGVLAGMAYAAFLMMFRAANASLAPTAAPLLDSTLGTAAGAILCAAFDPHFSLIPTWPAHQWLILLALLSQVVGWLLIATALPRLPAVETSIMLLVQPIFSVIWGVLLFHERLSPMQWTGSALVLVGVATLSVSRSTPTTNDQRLIANH
jgi:drug/metabolite transporter (DMT)-like permease